MLALGFRARSSDVLRPLFQQLKLALLEQPETRSQEPDHSEGGEQGRDEGNSSEIDEVATARRTGTMLLEKGRR